MSMVELGRSYDPHRPSQYSHSHRGSPHLQHLDHSSAHSTPSPPYQYAHLPMISQQQQAPLPQARSTPTSYPSPASYPSPSMSAYQYPSGQQQQQPGSRGSPYSQPISLPSLNLPPIRLNPPPGQLPPPPPPQQPQISSPLMGSPLSQPSQPLGYYPPHGLPPSSHPTHPNNITSSPIQGLRYQLPSTTNDRIMSGGRHKKEIKRRTKTGCLTCRKRRIKCDEAHPTCKNCAKSKRDCLGYDPIFKAQPGPAAIQPAPSIGGSTPQSTAPLYSFSYPVPNPLGGQNCAQTNSTAPSSPTSEVYDYPPVIDPALEAPILGNPTASVSTLPEPGTSGPGRKRPLDRDSPFSSGSDTTANRVTPIPHSTTPGLGRLPDNPGGTPAKRIKIDDLLSVVSTSQPPTPPSSETAPYATPSTTVEDMRALYKKLYAPALDKFLETGWFMGPGLDKVLSDNHLVELMAEIFERFRVRGGSFVEEEDPSIGRKGKSAGVLWAGVKMVYGTSIPAADNRQDEDEDDFRDEDGAETLRRINIVEALVTGQPLEPTSESPRVTSADKITEASPTTLFWRFLGRVVAARGGDAEINKQMGNTFADCEQFIEGKESRKLLLTIAEARHLGSRHYGTLADPTTAEASTHLLGPLRSRIEGIAKEAVGPGSSLSRRIAGRAVGQWREAITDTSFLC